jgi:hypothetical protein
MTDITYTDKAPGGTWTSDDANEVKAAVNSKANTAAPALTGDATAVTQATTDDSTKIATTEFVHAFAADEGAEVLVGIGAALGSPTSILVTYDDNGDPAVTPISDVTSDASKVWVTDSGGATVQATYAEIAAGVEEALLEDTALGIERIAISVVGSGTDVDVGNGTAGVPIPASMNGWLITSALAAVHTKGVTGTTTVQIRRRRAGTDADVLSTRITIGDEFFAADGVIDASNDDLATGDMLFVDVDTEHSTEALGLSVVLEAQQPA